MNLPLPPMLVVDDDKNMRRSLSTMLADEGYAVRAAESADQTLTLDLAGRARTVEGHTGGRRFLLILENGVLKFVLPLRGSLRAGRGTL